MAKKKELIELLDQYINGEKGYYYWEIEINEKFSKGQFGGGMFSHIDDARKHMIERMIRMLTEGK